MVMPDALSVAMLAVIETLTDNVYGYGPKGMLSARWYACPDGRGAGADAGRVSAHSAKQRLPRGAEGAVVVSLRDLDDDALQRGVVGVRQFEVHVVVRVKSDALHSRHELEELLFLARLPSGLTGRSSTPIARQGCPAQHVRHRGRMDLVPVAGQRWIRLASQL